MLLLSGVIGVAVAFLLAGAAGGAADLTPAGRLGPVELFSTAPGLALDAPRGTPAKAIALAQWYLAVGAATAACFLVSAVAWLQAQIPTR